MASEAPLGGAWEAGADLVVVGSGVAGLTAALDAARAGLRVVVVTKDAADAGSTRWAQGGVAVVVGDVPGDSVDAHVADTLTAGAGLCDPAAVASILTDGPAAVARLRARGAVFDATPTGALARTREGGHSAFRVVRAGGDATGAEVERALVAAARGAGLPLLTGHVAVDALRAADGTVAGVTVLDDAGRPGVLHAPAVLLATGGYGQLFASTTNPADVDRRRRRAGPARRRRPPRTSSSCSSTRPSCTYPERAGSGRWSPRRSGARARVLRDRTGAPVHASACTRWPSSPRGTSSPRRSPGGWPRPATECVCLDATAVEGFAARFPTVTGSCRAAGIDPAREPIPVTPAAHYACGGVVTDVDGRTAVPGLYAAGEVARTGLHGANRLASNSRCSRASSWGRGWPRAVVADLARAAPVAVGAAPAPMFAVADRRVVQRAMTPGRGSGGTPPGWRPHRTPWRRRPARGPCATARASRTRP